MDGSATAPSPQLLEANRRLHALRAQLQARRAAAAELPAPCETAPISQVSNAAQASAAAQLATLPAHLGWESAALTAVLRRRQQDAPHKPDVRTQPTRPSTPVAARGAASPSRPSTASPRRTAAEDDAVKLYPDLGLGMLRAELAAPGRLWLLLRHLDRDGRGVVCISHALQQLATARAELRLCGKRQLRNLLRAGEGVYWMRDKTRIWLCSTAKVAHQLGVTRLAGRPVALPLTTLLNGIGQFRAHLYAAFHSGRTRETPHGEHAMPIARETMAALSGIGPSSQRAYEARTGIRVQANFAVGPALTREAEEQRAWMQGGALFELKDHRGRQGKPGKTYLAWQLPNTYIGRHQQRPKGRQKRLNREIKDLVMKGMPGNVEGASETPRPERRYYPTGKQAAKAYGRDPKGDRYWRSSPTGNRQTVLWQQLGEA